MVFQLDNLITTLNASENVQVPMFESGRSAGERRRRALELLGIVGLSGREKNRPAELSGGERQRVAIARALVHRPECVLGDEPTGNLDRRTAEQVYELMLELNRAEGTSFVVVTHDPQLAQRMDQVWRLDDGVLTPASTA